MTPHQPTSDLPFDLYAEWEDRRANGETVTFEQVCADHQSELPRVYAIARQLADAPFLHPAPVPGDACTDPAAGGPPPAAGRRASSSGGTTRISGRRWRTRFSARGPNSCRRRTWSG